MSYLRTKKFWLDAAERAVKTFCQTAVATIAAAGVTSLIALDIATVGGVSGLATLLSVLTSIASGPLGGGNGDASAVDLKAAEAEGEAREASIVEREYYGGEY